MKTMNNKKILIFLSLLFLLLFSITAVNAQSDNDTVSVEPYNTNIQEHNTLEDKNTVDNHNEIKNNGKTIKQASPSKIITVNDDYGNDFSGTGTKEKPYKSIQKAIGAANNNDKIHLTSGWFYIESYDPITIYKNLTIYSTQKDKTVITSYYNRNINLFQIAPGATVEFSNIYFLDFDRISVITNHGNLSLKNCDSGNFNYYFYNDKESSIIKNYQNLNMTNCKFGYAKGDYGAVLYNRGFANLTNCNFSNNKANLGGVIYNYCNNITIRNCNFTENTVYGAPMEGWDTEEYIMNKGLGGVIFNKANCNIINSLFDGNYIDEGQYHRQGAGAIYNNGTLNIKNSKLINNRAYGSAGAIYNEKNIAISNSTLTDNYAETNGGALLNIGIATIDSSQFNQNKAFRGSAILNGVGTSKTNMKIINSKFTNNNAGMLGTIYSVSDLSITNSIISNNYAESEGSAVWSKDTCNINNCSINNNCCGYGGTITSSNNLTITNSIITNNQANETGGAISSGGKLIAKNNYFKNNKAYDGGAIKLDYTENTIINYNTFESNSAENYGGAIFDNEGYETSIRFNNFINNKASLGGAIYSNTSGIIINYNKFIKNKATYGSAIYNLQDDFKIKYNNFTMNSLQSNPYYDNGYSVNNYGSHVTNSNNVNYFGTKYPSTIENDGSYGAITNNRFENSLTKIKTNTTVYKTTGMIGDKITLKATVKDLNGNNINGGHVIFKINGITIKNNGQINGSNTPLKVLVNNGVAQCTITAYLNIRSGKTITAVYSGTDIYNSSRSNTQNAQIKLRSASISVKTNTSITKQDNYIKITATVKDKDKSSLMSNPTEYVYFKINGITIKDSKGQVLKVKLVNGVATYDYKVPLGLSGVTDGKTLKAKNHIITAGYYNPNYKPDTKVNTTFQVERSNISIKLNQIVIYNKTKKISITGTIKDYNNNLVLGNNKVVIKINGVTLKDSNKPRYFQVVNGEIKLFKINIPSYNTFNEITMVTQDRLAYKNAQTKTTYIKILNE